MLLTAAVLAAFAAFGQFGSDVFFVEDARRTGPLIIESAASPTPAVSDVPNTALVGNSPAAALVAVAPTSLPKITPVVMPATPEPVEAPETVFQTPRASPSESAVKTEAQADNTSAQASEEARVWIPQSGSRYHANQNCSGMQNPKETTIEDAKQQGFSPCLRCKPPE